MEQAYWPQQTFVRNRSLLLVVALHVLLVWALMSGTARRELDKLTASVPLKAVLLQRVFIKPLPPQPATPPSEPRTQRPLLDSKKRVAPPSPPLPLPPRPLPALPKKQTQPEPKPGPPELSRIRVPDLPETKTPESPLSVRPPVPTPLPLPRSSEPPGAVASAPALGSAAPTSAPRPGVTNAEKGTTQAIAAVARPSAPSDIGLVCPTQVVPEVPRRAIKEGIQGTVNAQARVVDGVVTAVEIVSGPRVFHAAVRNAMLQYKCVPIPGEVLATQEFNFRN